MIFDEYKAKLNKIEEDTAFHSAARMWINHPLFEELVNDEDAKAHCYTLLLEAPSWQLYSIVVRVWPDIDVPRAHWGLFKELRTSYLDWIEGESVR